MATTTTVNKHPSWDIAEPNVKHITSEAKRIYEAGAPGYYPGQTVAALTPEQLASQRLRIAGADTQAELADAGANTAIIGQAGIPTAVSTMAQLATGQGPLANHFANQAAAAVNKSWGGTGTFGSARHASTLGQGVGSAIADKSLEASQNLANLGLSSANLTKDMQEAALAPGTTYAGVGRENQLQNQAEIDAAIDKYNYNANLPSKWLQNYMNLTPNAVQNPVASSTSDQRANTFEKILGIGSLLLGGKGLLG